MPTNLYFTAFITDFIIFFRLAFGRNGNKIFKFIGYFIHFSIDLIERYYQYRPTDSDTEN